MKALILALRILGGVCLAAAFLLILAGAIGIWAQHGFREMLWMFSPFNFWNWHFMVVAIAPAGALFYLADHLAEKLPD